MMSGPREAVPGDSSVNHDRPSKVVKVWPRQKSGSGALTRMTTPSPMSPRTEVSSDWLKPG